MRVDAEDRPKSRLISDGVFYLVAGVCGLLVGVLGAAFHLIVDTLLAWPVWLATRLGAATRVEVIAAAAGVAAAGVMAAYLLTRRIAPEAAGSGVQEIEGAMAGLRVVRWLRVLPVKFVGGVLALSSGLVAGREGPTIHIGAAVAAALASGLRLAAADLRGLLAAGAAAGLAAAFNAPLAAILFVIEETRKEFTYTFRFYSGVIIASASSAIGMELVGGTAPPLGIAADAVPLAVLPAFVLLGAGLGVLGVVFNGCLIGLLDWATAAFRRVPFVPALVVGAATGALAIVLPEATGGGERLILRMVADNLPMATLLLIAALRFAGTMAAYCIGVPGGIFAPILALATALGLALGTALEGAFALPPMTASAFAVAAMGGLFASTVRAPLVAVVLAVELTGAYVLILPVIVTCAIANVVAEWLHGQPIYEMLLERTLRLAGQGRSAAAKPAFSSPVGFDGKS
jgi:chloride channel protein, CIC family